MDFVKARSGQGIDKLGRAVPIKLLTETWTLLALVAAFRVLVLRVDDEHDWARILIKGHAKRGCKAVGWVACEVAAPSQKSSIMIGPAEFQVPPTPC